MPNDPRVPVPQGADLWQDVKPFAAFAAGGRDGWLVYLASDVDVARAAQQAEIVALVESDRFLQGQVAKLEGKVARLTAAREAQDAKIRALADELSVDGLNTYEDGGAVEGLYASSTVAEMFHKVASRLAALLAAEDTPGAPTP